MDAERLDANRMEDEGGPPLPEEGGRSRSSTQRFQRSRDGPPSGARWALSWRRT